LSGKEEEKKKGLLWPKKIIGGREKERKDLLIGGKTSEFGYFRQTKGSSTHQQISGTTVEDVREGGGNTKRKKNNTKVGKKGSYCSWGQLSAANFASIANSGSGGKGK